MKKNKILGICSLILAVALVAGGTLAYFTASDKNTNTFTVGNVDILLDEAPVTRTEIADSEGAFEYLADATADRVKANVYDTIYPGAYLPKDPTVHNEGENVAKLRVVIDMSNEDEVLGLFNSAEDMAYTLFENLNVNYGAVEGKDFRLVANVDDTSTEYNVPANHRWFVLEYTAHDGNLQVNGDTTVFTAVDFRNAEVASYLTNDNITALDNLEINVYAYAVQAESFPGWTAEVTAGGAGVPAMYR